LQLKAYKRLSEIQADLNIGSISLPDLVEDYLKKIKAQAHLNCFLEVFEQEAKTAAVFVQKKIENKIAGRLAGMVIGIKDNICYKNHKSSASSKILENFESLFSATVVERLIQEDAIIIGRCNSDEFAMGSSNENSAYGNVLNPIDNTKTPGGSSGGSAVAVAAGLCLAALGSDTGGSIRQPASFCGVVGLKPTYGRISRHGLIAYASSFDQIGPITNSVEDVALILEIIAGSDNFDSTASVNKPENYSQLEFSTKKLKIGYLKESLESPGMDVEIKNEISEIIAALKKEGHTLEPINFPYLDYLVPAYYVLTTAEASSNLSRFDGIHFGYRSKDAVGIDDVYYKSRSEGFGEEVKRRIMLGTFVLSAGYYDAYYANAQKIRRVLKNKIEDLYKSFDLILMPTTPTTAFTLGEKSDDPIAMYLQDIFTVLANLVGLPAISLPMGKHSNGLPFGIQLMAPAFKEKELLEFSNMLMNSPTFKN
jgi:aspartyl-tRNA(Asn)/glutamyl-tRNA(Gln) amidotransferase subunit A